MALDVVVSEIATVSSNIGAQEAAETPCELSYKHVVFSSTLSEVGSSEQEAQYFSYIFSEALNSAPISLRTMLHCGLLLLGPRGGRAWTALRANR